MIEKAGPMIDAIKATVVKLGPIIDRSIPVVDQAKIAVERAGVAFGDWGVELAHEEEHCGRGRRRIPCQW